MLQIAQRSHRSKAVATCQPKMESDGNLVHRYSGFSAVMTYVSAKMLFVRSPLGAQILYDPIVDLELIAL